MADGDRRRWAGRRGQRQGWQIPHPAAGLQRESAQRLHPAAVEDLQWLRPPALQPQERQRLADIAKAVAYGKRIKFYPLSQASNTPQFVDVIDAAFDSTIPYDLRFLGALDRFVQREPWLDCDRVMIDFLKTIGIEKGKPFNPDEKTKHVLKRGWCARRNGSSQVRKRVHAAVLRGDAAPAERRRRCSKR